jgi:hypothetical protein
LELLTAPSRELVEAGEVQQPTGDDGALERHAADVEQTMPTQHLGLSLVVLGDGEQALYTFHLVLAVLAGQPHAVGLEADLRADQAALAQGLQGARGGLVQADLVVTHVDAEAQHAAGADETGDPYLEDHALLYLLLRHPVAEMGQRRHQQIPDEGIVVLPSPCVELLGGKLPQLGCVHGLPRSWMCPARKTLSRTAAGRKLTGKRAGHARGCDDK